MRRTLAKKFWLLAVMALLIPAGAAYLAWAGEADAKQGEEEEEFDPRVYLEEDDEASGTLRAAQRALDSGNPRLAIEKYLAIIQNPKWANVVFPQTDRLYLPLSSLARHELTSLPKEGQALYQILKGKEADYALARAVASGDERALERVPVDYPGLDAAPRALFLLGERAWAGGEAGRAVSYWRRVLAEYPEWQGASRASLLARASLVSVQAGRQTEASALLGQLKQVSGLAKLRLGEREFLVADEIGSRLAAAGPGASAGSAGDGNWPTIGGDGAHAGIAGHLVDAGVCRWQMKLGSGGAADRETLARRGVPQRPDTNAPLRHPVASGGLVVLAGDSDVTALRAMSGMPVWKASLQAFKEDLPANQQALPAIGDGRVYVCLGQRSVMTRNSWMGRQGNETSSSVVMRAYGLESGKLVWDSARAANKSDAEFLKSVDLVSAPVYGGGYVYCPAVKRGSVNDVYVLGFDADSGRLAWKTFVCAAQPLCAGYNYTQVQAVEDCPPVAVGEGVVAVATNAGAIGVADASTGQLRWIYLYDRVEVNPRANRTGRVEPMTAPEVWAPCPPIVSGGMLYAAPQDCGEILALELATGKVKWKARRGAMRHLVGISGGRLLISGGKEVVAMSAANGKRMWSSNLASAECGLGLVGEDFVMVPTETALQRFDLTTGKLKASYLFKKGKDDSGNLVIVGDVLVTVGDGAAAGYYAWDQIVGKLRGEIETAPEKAAARAELGEVYFSAEKYAEAIDIFKEALERARPDEKVNGVLLAVGVKRQIWEAYSRLGHSSEAAKDFEKALGSYEEGHKYCVDPNQEMVGHMRFAECREALGDFPKAVEEYETVIIRYPEESYERGKGDVQAGRLAQSRIEKLIADKGREIYARFDGEARDLLAKAAAGKDATLARRVVRDYPNSQSVSPALILLGELHTAAGRPADAAATLREHLWKCRGSDRDTEVRARLAMAYRAQGMESLCRSMLKRIDRRSPEESFEIDGRKWSVKDFVAEHTPRAGAAVAAFGAIRPDMTPPLSAAWKANVEEKLAGLVPKDEALGGPEGLIVCFGRNAQGGVGGSLVAFGADSGKLAWNSSEAATPGAPSPMAFLALPGVVALAAEGKLKALSVRDGRKIWEQDLPTQQGGPWGGRNPVLLAAGDGVIIAVTTSISQDPKTNAQVMQQKILAFDEGAGQPIWAIDGEKGGVQQAEVAEGVLLVSTMVQARMSANRRVTAYELADGHKRFAANINGWGGMFMTRGESLLVPGQTSIDCYDVGTGKLRWRGQMDGANQLNIVALDDERVVCCGMAGGAAPKGRLMAWEMSTGKRQWVAESDSLGGFRLGTTWSGARMSTCVGSTARIPLGDYDMRRRKSSVSMFDGTNGKLLWRSELPLNAQVPQLTIGSKHVGGVIGAQGARAQLRVWDIDSGKLVASQPANLGDSLVADGDALLLFGADGSVQRLRSGATVPGRPASQESSAEKGKE